MKLMMLYKWIPNIASREREKNKEKKFTVAQLY